MLSSWPDNRAKNRAAQFLGGREKKRHEEESLEAVGVKSFAWLKEGIAANDHAKILEGLDGITEGAKQYVWQMLDTHQHATIREALATKE